jgi:Ser/Thr protein kinase RdoA (MazF antagonist)
MIPVPQTVLDNFAIQFHTSASHFKRIGGGREDSDGIVYAYPYQERQRLLKIMAIPATDRQDGLFRLDERLKFMRFLGENGAPIAFPQLTPTGEVSRLYETFSTEEYAWVGYCMEISPGKTVSDRRWDADFFCKWGQVIGQLHRLTQQYPSWEASIDPVSGKQHLTWLGEWQSFYTWNQDEEIKQKWIEIRQQLKTLPLQRNTFGFIHNDPHIWNLLYDGTQITILDFDVANHHWFINDLAIACQSLLFSLTGGMERPVYDRRKLIRFYNHFLEGYAKENTLAPEWLDRLDLFIAYRRILLFTVMQGWITSKPELHKSWKSTILAQPEVLAYQDGFK